MAVEARIHFGHGGRAVIRISAVLGAPDVPALRAPFTNVLAARPGEILVDLHGCGFADSAGPTLLSWLLRRGREEGLAVFLSGLAEDEEAFLRRAGLTEQHASGVPA